MLKFKQFIYLLESKIQEIKQAHINKGHPPNEVEDVITRAHQANKQGAKINISGPFGAVKQAVHEHEQKSGKPETLYDDGKTQIYEIKTKKQAIDNYGHGKTNWCVAATGKKNAWNSYSGRMITAHHDGKFYAYHQREGTWLNQHQEEADDRTKLIPKDVKHAVSHLRTSDIGGDVVRHANIALHTDSVTHEDLTDAIKNPKGSDLLKHALTHPKITPEHIDLSLDHHPEYTSDGITARSTLLKRPDLSEKHLTKIFDTGFPSQRHKVVLHPNVTDHILKRAMDTDEDTAGEVAKHIIKMRKINARGGHLKEDDKVFNHPNPGSKQHMIDLVDRYNHHSDELSDMYENSYIRHVDDSPLYKHHDSMLDHIQGEFKKHFGHLIPEKEKKTFKLVHYDTSSPKGFANAWLGKGK